MEPLWWSLWFLEVWIRIPRAGHPVVVGVYDAVSDAADADDEPYLRTVVVVLAIQSATTWDVYYSHTFCLWSCMEPNRETGPSLRLPPPLMKWDLLLPGTGFARLHWG